MSENKTDLLKMLKFDLQLINNANDEYLAFMLESSKKLILQEGISDDGSKEFELCNVHYAAYLFRKRAAPETTMPRYLRYELNNLLFHQKAKAGDS